MSAFLASIMAFVSDIARRLVNWIDLDFWELLLLFMFFMLARLLWKAHTATGNNFDIKYLLIDEGTSRVSLKKLGALLALLTSTWIVLFMTVKGSITESILGLYLFVWAGVYVTPQSIAAWRAGPPTPPAAPNSGSA